MYWPKVCATALLLTTFLHYQPTPRLRNWCTFMDSSNGSLKAVSLHNSNWFTSILAAHSVNLTAICKTIKKMLKNISYEHYNLVVCWDFKILGFLLRLQGGYTPYSCFLCLRDSNHLTSITSKQNGWPENNSRHIYH